ncbi:hypothetical protein [Rhodococcus gannanensis]|uniref:Uncharacterized protein n=1 Tax=Rhodococcus gannanensis TaxID=1960308 RepID=A0ABW4P335_9NOCA
MSETAIGNNPAVDAGSPVTVNPTAPTASETAAADRAYVHAARAALLSD